MARRVEGQDEKEEVKCMKKNNSLTLQGTPEYESFAYNESNENFLYMTSIRAPFFRDNERSTLDLVVAIDQSGSMDGERIKMVIETVTFLIKNLENEDRFSIVVYDDKAKILLPLTKMDEYGKKKSLNLVTKIRATGSTALYDGLITSIKVMQERNKNEQNSVSSIMLFTDGEANVGLQKVEDIINGLKNLNVINNNKPKNDNIENEGENANVVPTKLNDNQIPMINTFGFGEGHNETLLSAIAEFGNGTYTYIKNTEMIADVFGQCLGGLISIVGKNIQIKIKSLNNVKIIKCLSEGLNVKNIKPNEEFIINYSDIQSEEARDVLWQLSLPILNKIDQHYNIATISYEYNNLINENKNDTGEIIATIQRLDENEVKENKIRNYNVDIQNNRIIAVEAMDSADKFGNSGNLDEARKVLKNAIQTIQDSVSSNDSFCKNLITDIEICQSALKDKHAYDNYGGKMLKMNYMSHTQQRNCDNNWSGQMTYSNCHQMSMQSKFVSKNDDD